MHALSANRRPTRRSVLANEWPHWPDQGCCTRDIDDCIESNEGLKSILRLAVELSPFTPGTPRVLILSLRVASHEPRRHSEHSLNKAKRTPGCSPADRVYLLTSFSPLKLLFLVSLAMAPSTDGPPPSSPASAASIASRANPLRIPELLSEILGNLDQRSLERTSQVSKAWLSVSTEVRMATLVPHDRFVRRAELEWLVARVREQPGLAQHVTHLTCGSGEQGVLDAISPQELRKLSQMFPKNRCCQRIWSVVRVLAGAKTAANLSNRRLDRRSQVWARHAIPKRCSQRLVIVCKPSLRFESKTAE